ncbi:antibiotic biosynthesis monooxygenase [Mycolicibacterium fluoranthenivorans]|jgi:antibiotic biosynthesis monooxygenase (ABM) superfamily enzyme|nr:antibiotic biosynthesis monooxygenase [Mycolicibacterium fluoranthenivorans]
MDAKRNTDMAATVIIGQPVRAGREREFEAWQLDLNRAASEYPGFLAAEVSPPTAVQPDWVVVYRFDSVAHVQAWINSATRQDRLAAGADYLDGPGTQQVIGGGARPTDPLVTVVVSHRVSPEHVEDFLAWQQRLRLAESKFRGFRGAELFRPVAGVQDEWTALYRYENADDLDAWLISPERRALLAEGERFSDFHARTIDNSFGSWFAFDEHGAPAAPPSDVKTSLAVWVGLYPTVVLLSLALSPLKMPLWLGMLIGNLLSSFAMSFITMPYYVNPLLKHWLRPPPDVPVAKTNWRGIGTVAAVMAATTAAVYLGTRVFWHLP